MTEAPSGHDPTVQDSSLVYDGHRSHYPLSETPDPTRIVFEHRRQSGELTGEFTPRLCLSCWSAVWEQEARMCIRTTAH